MRKVAVLVIALTAILMFVAVVMVQSLVILQRVAVVNKLQGQVWVKPRAQTRYVALRTYPSPSASAPRVASGDTIKTGPASTVMLRWLDGTQMRIGPDTVMTVLKTQTNTATRAETSLFRLNVGRVWIRVLKILSQKSKFEVETPTATAGVRGTIFSVAVNQTGATTVSVKQGTVAVATGDQQEEVGQGQMETAGRVASMDPAEKALWQVHQAVTRPHLKVDTPANGALVAPGQNILVRGTAEPGAVVTVNGMKVALGPRAEFLTQLTAPGSPGDLQIKVTVTDARGYQSLSTLRLQVR